MIYESNYLAHHGVKGMKWGVRKYQNPDGSLTVEGYKRYYAKYDKLYDKYNSIEGKQKTAIKQGTATGLAASASVLGAALAGASPSIALLSGYGGLLVGTFGSLAISRAAKTIDANRYKKIGTLLSENTDINSNSNEGEDRVRMIRNYSRGIGSMYIYPASNDNGDRKYLKTKDYDFRKPNKRRTYIRN